MTEKVFVYGTLKRGGTYESVMQRAGGHFLSLGCLKDAGHLRSTRLFPYLILDEPKMTVHGELWEVDDLEPLDRLEGYPHHYNRDRVLVLTPNGECWAYVYHVTSNDRMELLPICKDGIWIEGA